MVTDQQPLRDVTACGSLTCIQQRGTSFSKFQVCQLGYQFLCRLMHSFHGDSLVSNNELSNALNALQRSPGARMSYILHFFTITTE